MKSKLPPGQYESDNFPRFGLSQYANRFPVDIDSIRLIVGKEGFTDVDISKELEKFSRVEQTSDFHCVTTWSKSNQVWTGVRFKDFYEQLVRPRFSDADDLIFVIFKAQDGYKTGLYLEDVLKDNVLLADHLNGEPLSIEHGAPLRLIAPDHYGYKNLKHLKRIEFYTEKKKVKQGILGFMDHPRARVAYEERAVGGPGWFFRFLYRPLVKSTAKQFDKAMKKYYAMK